MPDSEKGLAALINPRSFRMSRGSRAKRSSSLVREHGGQVYQVGDLGEIEQALDQAFRKPPDKLIIAGGDGTVQGAVTWLIEKYRGPVPDLVILSAGRSNYIAGDIATCRHFHATLVRILNTPVDRLQSVERVTLRLEHPSIGVQHGFFMAGALVDQVIRNVHRWHEQDPRWHNRGHFGSAFGVMRFGFGYLNCRNRRPLPEIEIEADGLGTIAGCCRFLVATTLQLQRRPLQPYARRGHGPLRVTAVLATADGWARRMPRLLSGRFSDRMDESSGYLSGACEQVLSKGINSVTLDGQEFDLDPATPLQLSSGPALRFLRA